MLSTPVSSTPPRMLPVGLSVTQRVCASIANLGAGFDSLGIGLGIYDSIEVTVIDHGLHITMVGEGEKSCPRDESHLVVQGIMTALSLQGLQYPGLQIHCHNVIPQARGLGSSAAAFTGGLGVGVRLMHAIHSDLPSLGEIVNAGGQFEGHADNSSASILGGGVISWKSDTHYHATGIALHPDVCVYVCIPHTKGFTSHARSVLPDDVPRSSAVHNLSRSALLVHALTRDPQYLYEATDDKLHQPYRHDDKDPSYQLLHYLRGHNIAACIGGAGPTVAVLGIRGDEYTAHTVQQIGERNGFQVLQTPIGRGLDIF